MFSLESEQALLQRLIQSLLVYDFQIIAAVWPLPEEIDLRWLISQLEEMGKIVVLPETPKKGFPLIFRQWTKNSKMLDGLYGTQYPEGRVMQPDVVLVPFLAFDRKGYRLGYGGGYYDRTLTQSNVMTVGYGFSFQEVNSVPIDEYDIPLSVIITERETIQVK
ncbi:5-formyltetrahydrofolate cyclo-ligase [Swingsia samuiensis]